MKKLHKIEKMSIAPPIHNCAHRMLNNQYVAPPPEMSYSSQKSRIIEEAIKAGSDVGVITRYPNNTLNAVYKEVEKLRADMQKELFQVRSEIAVLRMDAHKRMKLEERMQKLDLTTKEEDMKWLDNVIDYAKAYDEYDKSKEEMKANEEFNAEVNMQMKKEDDAYLSKNDFDTLNY